MRTRWLEVSMFCVLSSACTGLVSPDTDGGTAAPGNPADGSDGTGSDGGPAADASADSPGSTDATPFAVPPKLALINRYGVPVANASGIACDGDHVWLAAGGHNAPSHTLSYVELKSSAVEKQFTYSNLIEALGTGVYGITLLGGFVFVSVAGNTNKIVRIDPTSGAILQTFAAPTQLGPSDLDVSGGQLVESDGTGNVFTLSATGAVLGSFAAGGSARNVGVAVRGSEAFVAGLFGGIDMHDVKTGALLGNVSKQDGASLAQTTEVGPMCFNGPSLLILSSLGISEYSLVAAK